MKRKVGTTIDASLYMRVKEMARQQRRSMNELIEDALKRSLASGTSGASAVAETKGTFKISPKVLRAVLQENLYGVD